MDKEDISRLEREGEFFHAREQIATSSLSKRQQWHTWDRVFRLLYAGKKEDADKILMSLRVHDKFG